MIGFVHDEAESPAEVRDGQASERELSPREHCDLFVSLCERLRATGAVEVRSEKFRAVFPEAAANE